MAHSPEGIINFIWDGLEGGKIAFIDTRHKNMKISEEGKTYGSTVSTHCQWMNDKIEQLPTAVSHMCEATRDYSRNIENVQIRRQILSNMLKNPAACWRC